MQCAAHPKVETNLACGKCGTPICPRCLVHTPVGARCRDCARLKRLPIFEVGLRHYAIATGVGAGLAVGTGVGWYVLEAALPYASPLAFLAFYLRLAAIIGIGFLIGNVVSRSVNRKRGPGLAAIAGASVFLSYAVSSALMGVYLSGLWGLVALGVAIFVAVSRLR